ncbi:MAG: serine/threonine protein kinase, partial [Microbacterium sp.]
SRRAARPAAAPPRRAPDDGTVLAGSEPVRRPRTALYVSLGVVGALLLLGGAVTALALVLGGG